MSSVLPRSLGRYELLQRLGDGGMGTVYLAVQRTGIADRVCVIKTIRARTDARALQGRFLDEARTSLLLKHRNVCTTYDVIAEEGTTALVMELIAGCDCRRIAAEGAVPMEVTASIGCFVLDGLAYAHGLKDPRTGASLHLVHRDLSPHNVMVSFDGEVKIIDFGIAASAVQTSETAVGSFVGKIRYAAPEQVRTPGLVDGRADHYALAVMLTELASGERFYGDMTDDLIMLTLGRDVPFRSPALERVPPALRSLLERALLRAPERRIDGATLRRSLLALIGGEPSTALVRDFVRARFPDAEAEHESHLRRLMDGEATERVARFGSTLSDPARARSGADTSPTAEGDGRRVDVLAQTMPGAHARGAPSATPDAATVVRRAPPPALSSDTGTGARATEPLAPATVPARPASDADGSAEESAVFAADTSRAAGGAPSSGHAGELPGRPLSSQAPDVVDADLAAPTARLIAPRRPSRGRWLIAASVVAALVALVGWAVRGRLQSGPDADAAPDAGLRSTPDAGAVDGERARPVEVGGARDGGAVVVTHDAGPDSPAVVDIVDGGAERPPSARVPDAGRPRTEERVRRPRPLPPRPALLGQKVRYLEKHCRAVSCAAGLVRAAQSLADKRPEELRRFAQDIEGCLDRCGAP